MTELRLPVLPLPGLSPDSLGNYLASLGLLRILARQWPSTRIAWRDEVLQVVGGPLTLDALLDKLVSVATAREGTPYERAWSDEQKKSSDLAKNLKTAAESGVPFALWQARAAEGLLDGFAAHVVPHSSGRSMNPILGKAGKIGQRDFAKGWARAADSLMPAKASKQGKNESQAKIAAREKADAEAACADATRRRGDLDALLRGTPISWLEKDLNAATWFSHANKLYNNGQSAFRDGLLSPWAMALACEGLTFLAGGASRRLGTRARAVGAFPFVTKAAAPEASGQGGRDTAELWAPIWERPATVPEVVALFRRGRAELGARAVHTPAAFASAILRRGVDAGVVEFRRFVLGWTTAADYIEPRFQGAISTPIVNGTAAADALPVALERVTALMEQRTFPRDRKVGQRWRFEGVRGPIEAALLKVAAEPYRSESAIALLDTVSAALDKIDRNRGFRKGNVRWQPLPVTWLPLLFTHEPAGAEARLALSLASAFPPAEPFATYRFGVVWENGNYTHVERPPARWVWGPGELARVLSAVLSRRLLDRAAADAKNAPRAPGRAPLAATSSHVLQWLAADVDEPLLLAWLSRFSLFDWREIPRELRSVIRTENDAPRLDGALALFGLFQPVVDDRSLVVRSLSPQDLLSSDSGARTPGAARSLFTLVRSGNVDAALQLARSRYAMAGARLAQVNAPWVVSDSDRLVAALLFTISDRDRAVLFERWLRPRRRQFGVEANV